MKCWWFLTVAVLAVMVLGVESARDDCDFENLAMRKMCRKVESQAQYQEKMVDALYKSDLVYRWYTANKDWLNHPRLARMMKRMLNTRRIPLIPNGEANWNGELSTPPADKLAPSVAPTSGSDSEENSELAEVESKLVQLGARLEALSALVNATQTQVQQLVEQAHNSSAAGEALARNVTGLSHQLQLYHDHTQAWNASLVHLRANVTQLTHSQAKLGTNLTQVQLKLDNHQCNAEQVTNLTVYPTSAPSGPSQTTWQFNATDLDLANLTVLFESGLQRLKWEHTQELQALRDRLSHATDELRQAVSLSKADSGAAVANFSYTLETTIQRVLSTVDQRLDETSTALYNTLLNTSHAFTEDVFVMKSIVANASQQVAYLLGQDLKAQRYLEDMRSTGRRQDGLMQGFNNQLNDFRTHVQDQLNTLKNGFTLTVQELYQKIVERQNQISYRMSTLVDDMRSIKGHIRSDKNSRNGGASENSDSPDDEEGGTIALPDLDFQI